MKAGMYTPEIPAKSTDELFEKAADMGFEAAQYNFLSSHSEEMPKSISDKDIAAIIRGAEGHGIELLAVNGTFNMIGDDGYVREYLKRFEYICAAAAEFGGALVTLCTGSRSTESMWRYHPDTASEESWERLIRTTEKALAAAEKHDVCLGVETEASNVIFNISRARKYLDTFSSPYLKVILDPANLFNAGEAKRENVRKRLDDAFDLLGKDIALAHGKDILEGDGIAFTSPGFGIVDYAHYFALLKGIGYGRGLILHGIKNPAHFPESVRKMKDCLLAAGL